jgi:N-acetylglucosaminyldiphosphoundecaprenol N-acetyl-beta-D-mannosaminyltransferase
MIKVSKQQKKEEIHKEEAVLKKVPVISLMVNTISLPASLNKIMEWGTSHIPSYVCFANVHMVAEAHRDEDFRAQVNGASLVLPDGKPIVTAIRFFQRKKIERKAGMDFLPLTLRKADATGARIFLYGSSEEIQTAMIRRIQMEYPNVHVAGAIAPSFTKLSALETDDHISQIKASAAQIVFVSLGCPKQEKWMAENSERIPAVLLGVGGAFAVFAGLRKRAPQWMQKYSLEWLYRFIQEPRRMFGRYLYTNTLFLFLLAKKIIRG